MGQAAGIQAPEPVQFSGQEPEAGSGKSEAGSGTLRQGSAVCNFDKGVLDVAMAELGQQAFT